MMILMMLVPMILQENAQKPRVYTRAIESAAPSIESTVHKKRKEFALSMASGMQDLGCTPGYRAFSCSIIG